MKDGSYIHFFKRINKIRLLSIVICILIAFSSSCELKRDLRRNKQTETDVTQTPGVKEEQDNSELSKEPENTPLDNESKSNEEQVSDSDNISITFMVTNSCKEDIGMIAILDPVTDEQVNIGELPDGKLLSFSLDWPKEVTDFNIAIYNRNGDLVSESKIDITGVTEKVILLLSGDHNVEKVDAEIK